MKYFGLEKIARPAAWAVGGGVVGAGLGAAVPTNSWEDRKKNIAVGAGTGAFAGLVAGSIHSASGESVHRVTNTTGGKTKREKAWESFQREAKRNARKQQEAEQAAKTEKEYRDAVNEEFKSWGKEWKKWKKGFEDFEKKEKANNEEFKNWGKRTSQANNEEFKNWGKRTSQANNMGPDSKVKSMLDKLGIPKNIKTKKEAHKFWKKKAMEVHPDRNPGKDTTAAAQEVNATYVHLKKTPFFKKLAERVIFYNE